jgi:hypothetical protein
MRESRMRSSNCVSDFVGRQLRKSSTKALVNFVDQCRLAAEASHVTRLPPPCGSGQAERQLNVSLALGERPGRGSMGSALLR